MSVIEARIVVESPHSAARAEADGATRSINTSARDVTIDAERGLAILIMVAANMSAVALEGPHPLWLRFGASIAAPLFVMVSGMMVAETSRRRGYGFMHFFTRGALLVAIAAVTDIVVWHVYPFVSVDVLYLIGVCLPLARLVLGWSAPTRWAVIAGLILWTPLIQTIVGYGDYPTEVYVGRSMQAVLADAPAVARHWLTDGWFPLVPWTAFALLGVEFADRRRRGALPLAGLMWRRIALGLALVGCGAAMWSLQPGALLTRAGHTELFYPPTPGFVVTIIGVIVGLFAVVDARPGLRAYRPLRLLGGSALLIYLLHLVLIRFVIEPTWPDEPPEVFLALYCALVGVLLAAAVAAKRVKNDWRRPPLVARVLLGG